MTNQEAKAILEANAVPVFPLQLPYRDWLDALEMAAEALEKQIPKKPIGDLHSVPHYRCSVCKGGVKMYETSYVYPICHHCGQAIDWSEDNDD